MPEKLKIKKTGKILDNFKQKIKAFDLNFDIYDPNAFSF